MNANTDQGVEGVDVSTPWPEIGGRLASWRDSVSSQTQQQANPRVRADLGEGVEASTLPPLKPNAGRCADPSSTPPDPPQYPTANPIQEDTDDGPRIHR